MFSPLSSMAYRRMWVGSLFSNFGTLIQGVGAAWTMALLTPKANLVAFVQTAQSIPVFFLAMAAGALADMYDRRKIAFIGLMIGFGGSLSLAFLGLMNLTTPLALLAGVAITSIGGALATPSWQASVRDQVPPKVLPAAVALNSMSYNLARSFGPAIGGAIVATAGAIFAFIVNAASFLPMMCALISWKPVKEPTRLPPEGLGRALISGARYVMYSPDIRNTLVRTLLISLCSASITALLPIVVRDVLHGGADAFGLLLGGFGMGAVTAALNIARLRSLFSPEFMVRIGNVVLGLATILTAISTSLPLTIAALAFAGAGWFLSVNECNIVIQISVPRWVTGRAMAAFNMAIACGTAFGAWGWGYIAAARGVECSLLASAALLLFGVQFAGLWLRLSEQSAPAEQRQPHSDPEVALDLTPRSGPVRIEIEYDIDPGLARRFYGLMQEIRKVRSRTGGYGWSISRDVASPNHWIESYSTPTWLDYLRQRTRATQAERDLNSKVLALQTEGQQVTIRRLLERPFGSVRWKDNSPDDNIQDTALI